MTDLEALIAAIEAMLEIGSVSGDHFTSTAHSVDKVVDAMEKVRVST